MWPARRVVPNCASPIRSPPYAGGTSPDVGTCRALWSVAKTNCMIARHIGTQMSSKMRGRIPIAVAMSSGFLGEVCECVARSSLEHSASIIRSRTTLRAGCSLTNAMAPNTPPIMVRTPFAIPAPACTSDVPGHAPVAAIPTPITAERENVSKLTQDHKGGLSKEKGLQWRQLAFEVGQGLHLCAYLLKPPRTLPSYAKKPRLDGGRCIFGISFRRSSISSTILAIVSSRLVQAKPDAGMEHLRARCARTHHDRNHCI